MVLALVGSVWAKVRERKLTASDSARSDHFGGSVSLSGGGGTLVGAWRDLNFRGSAYMYDNIFPTVVEMAVDFP